MSTLYSYLLAFNPQKVLLAIAETGFECRVQQVNLFNGDSLRPSCASTPTQPCQCWW